MVTPEKTQPTSVIIAEEQPPVPVTIVGQDGEPSIPTATVPDIAPTITPVNMTMITPSALPRPDVVKGEGATLAPTTTEQDDLVTEGQRKVNLIWETTQSRIALMVVCAGVLLNSILVLMIILGNKEVTVTQLALISISLQFINLTVGIVIGFYFSRVNHQAKGGVGAQPQIEAYTGR